MNNEEKSYELIKYEDGDLSIDVHVSMDDNTVWLNQDEMAVLFDVDRTRIVRHINNIYSEGELDMNSTCAENALVQNEGNRKVKRNIKIYNLDMIIAVGYRTKSNKITEFRNWANNLANRLNVKNGSTKQLITFNYDEISLDVTVSPDEDTVWLSKEQIAVLFETTRQNVEYHIKNIYEQKELDEWMTCKEILHFTNESTRYKYRTNPVYNLDMIISLGYRINSKNGIAFRKWATSVLKEYLLTGHIVNEERCLTCTSNILSLENKVNKIQNEVNNLKDIIYSNNDKLFFEGEIVEAYSFIRKIFFLAKNELILIDNYADKFLLSMLTDIKVNITIITSINSYLNSEVLPNNIKIINNDSIHSRYIIADDYVYLIDNSFNNIGKKKLVIVKLDDINKDMIIKGIK